MSRDKRRKRKILKENSCPIRSLFAKKKKKKTAVHAELARKREASVCVTNFLVLFAAYRVRVAGPLKAQQKKPVPL